MLGEGEREKPLGNLRELELQTLCLSSQSVGLLQKPQGWSGPQAGGIGVLARQRLRQASRKGGPRIVPSNPMAPERVHGV